MMKIKCSVIRLIAASAIGFGLVGESNAQYTNTLTPDLKVTADTSKPGFIWNVFANDANPLDSPERTEDALAGRVTDAYGTLIDNLADPTVQGVAIAPSSAPSPANATIQFEIATVINMGLFLPFFGSVGYFTPDDQMPGLPSTTFTPGGEAGELITYLDLPAGLITMGVTSDDGFQTTAGKVYDAFNAILVGEFIGGDSGLGTLFYLNVQEAGVYPFRTTWENGGDNGAIEWYTVKTNGDKVLVNDVGNGGVAAYRAITSTIRPHIKSVLPGAAPRQLHTTYSSLQIVLADGTTAVDDATIALKVDGNPITPVKTRNGSLVTLTYTPTTIQFPGDHHTAELTFKDVLGTYTRTERWPFHNLKNIVLPTPVLTENFDSYAEGSVPTGWTAWNFSTTNIPGLNLDDLHSDSYLGWIVVSRVRLAGLKGEIAYPAAPGQMSNGVPVTIDELMQGNILYAESDVRGGSQVQFVTTSPFNLSTVANPVLSFFALYHQNQDSLGAVEYSVDGGTTWLPVVYYLDYLKDHGDIRLNPDGTVNAVATFTNANPDTASWTDGGPKGGNYGDGIAAPISQALGRFIAPRENDNPVADKRLEIYRLPMAGHKSDVRLRFAQLGTGSWYFGLDNLAFYDVATPVVPRLSIALAAGNVTISWTGDGTLLEATTLAGPWTVSWNQANPQTLPAAGSKFYKIGPP